MVMVIFSIGISTSAAYGHKLIDQGDTHRGFESALQIPDHRISWAIYENLGPGGDIFTSLPKAWFDTKLLLSNFIEHAICFQIILLNWH